MKKLAKSISVNLSFIIAISVSQASFAQLTIEELFDFLQGGFSGEEARQPGSNNVDVELCKAFIEENGVFPNLGKCANMTPADYQFFCRDASIRELAGARNKGECVSILMSLMIEDF